MQRFFLPPYCPHLNPDEPVWGNLQARVAKETSTDKPTLKAQLTAALERLTAMPQRVAGFFRHPHCRYILDALGSA